LIDSVFAGGYAQEKLLSALKERLKTSNLISRQCFYWHIYWTLCFADSKGAIGEVDEMKADFSLFLDAVGKCRKSVDL